MEIMFQNTSSAEALKFANPGPGTGGARPQVLEMHGATGSGALPGPWCRRCSGPGAGGARELVGSLQRELHTGSAI